MHTHGLAKHLLAFRVSWGGYLQKQFHTHDSYNQLKARALAQVFTSKPLCIYEPTHKYHLGSTVVNPFN